MYLNGLADAETDFYAEMYYDDMIAADDAAYYEQNALPSISGADWIDGIKTALQTGITAWTQKNNAETQLEIARIQAQQRQLPGQYVPGYTRLPATYRTQPGSSPFPGQSATFAGLDMTTLLILAALAAGGYYLLKD